MTHTAPAEFLLKRTMGPRIVPLDLARIEERAAAVPAGRAAALWRDTARRAAAVEVPEAEGTAAAAFYVALRETVGEQGLDALAVGCYPRLMGRVCLAASLLADEGIPLACEGDVHGAIAQYVLARLSGRPTHNADWLDPLPDGSVVFTHCGSGSFDIAAPGAPIRLAPVRLMGQGVCALFPAAAGPVTMLSLSAGTERYELALLEGEAFPAEMVFPGNPLRVRFPAPVAAVMAWIHREGIGHHWMAGYGRHATAVRDWVSMTGGDVRLLLPPDEPDTEP